MTFQLCFLLAAACGWVVPQAPFRVARYYVLTTASIAVGLWDRDPPRLAGDLGEGGGDALTLPRAFDLIVSVLTLVVLSPLLLVVGVAIRLGSRGPVLYRQRRVGLDGREFEMLKLRTMVEGSDPVGYGTVVTRDDPRVTGVGPLSAPHLAR